MTLRIFLYLILHCVRARGRIKIKITLVERKLIRSRSQMAIHLVSKQQFPQNDKSLLNEANVGENKLLPLEIIVVLSREIFVM